MKDRIREARKAMGLSREKFAEGLGLKSRGKIDNIELGRVDPDESFLQLISKVYKINYNWLITGQGSMFGSQDSRDEEISRFIGEALADEDDNFKVQLLHVLSNLTDEQWEVLADVAELLLEEQQSRQAPPE